MTTVFFNGAACGAGKTQDALDTIAKGCELSEKVLFVSRTKELSTQSYTDFQDKLVEKGSDMNGCMVTSDTVDTGMVTASINRWFRSDVSGVCFATHASLALIDVTLLKSVSIVCDEVPSGGLVKHHLVMVAKCGFASIAGMVEQIPVDGKGYRHVKVKANKEAKLREVIKGHELGKQNGLSDDFLNVLRILVDSKDVKVYSFYSEDRDQYCFGCLDVTKLEELIEGCESLTVLSANIERSVIGYVLTEHLGYKITQSSVFKRSALAQKHNKKITVYPLLSNGTWSKSLKNKSVKSAFGVDDSGVVGEWAVKTSNDILGRDYLLYQNKGELKERYDIELDGVTRRNVIVHGLNKYNYYHKAAFLASLVPTPMEIHFYKVLCDDIGLNYSEFEEILFIERMYEVCYQCLARTSIRNFDGQKNEIKFVVPDMCFVEYLKNMFDDGCITIDASFSQEVRKRDYNKEEAHKKERVEAFELFEAIDNRRKGVTIQAIYQSYGMSRATYQRRRKKYLDVYLEMKEAFKGCAA